MSKLRFGDQCLRWLAVVCAVTAFSANVARAHRTGESYVFLNVTETTLQGRFEINFIDLNKVVPFDDNDDGSLTREEFKNHADEAGAYLQKRLTFRSGQTLFEATITATDVRRLDLGDYALFSFDVPGITKVSDEIDVHYAVLFDSQDPTHRGLLVIESNSRTGTVDNEAHFSAIFAPGEEWQTISFLPQPVLHALVAFVWHGMWHIWIGFDHILFIVSLLLPSVLILKDKRWVPNDTFSQALWYVIKVMTLFTIAHSITLSLASLGIVSLPSSPVECLIALSIAVTAFNNIRPMYPDKIWLIVFGFGLFHGFGFAGVLAPLGLNPSNRLVSLFGFNVGVEIGQIAIVCAVFPILFVLRRWRYYNPLILRAGSMMLITMAMIWFAERGMHMWQRAQEKGIF